MMQASKRSGKKLKGTQRNATSLPSQALKRRTDASPALPNELWSHVLNYVSNKDLKKLRLVGDRHLGILASSQLFHTAYVAARRGVLDIFMQIATHPTIRHFIKEVIFDSSWFDPPDGVNRMRNGNYRVTDACTDLSLAKLFQEQEAIQTKEMVQCLITAFAALTCVRRVVLADLSRTAGLIGDSADPDGNPLSNRISSGDESPYFAQGSIRGRSIRMCDSHRGGFERQSYGLLLLLRVLSHHAPTTFTELSLGDGRHSSDRISYLAPFRFVGSSFGGIPDGFFTPMLNSSLDNFHYDVFRRLRKLELTICFSSKPRSTNRFSCPDVGSGHYLGELLSVADDLEDLKLCGHIDTACLELSETLGKKTWSKLRILELKYFQANRSDMEDLFTRHQYTLKHVQLDFFNLVNGAWKGLFGFVLSELPETSLTIGWGWQNGDLLEVQDDGNDALWLPRKKEDRHSSEADEPELGDDDRESSSEEELDYSSGSEGYDDEDLNADMLGHSAR